MMGRVCGEWYAVGKVMTGMPYELRDFAPALRFLQQEMNQNLMLVRSVRQGPRPGFAVIVDDPERVRAVLTVVRPDWKKPDGSAMTLELDATDKSVAIDLLAWLPQGIRYQVRSYRPWLQDVINSMLVTQRVCHRVHCLATPEAFLPSGLEGQVQELPIRDEVVRVLAECAPSLEIEQVSQLFGLLEGDRILAFSALGRPDTDWVSVNMVYTREGERARGLGTAVLSAATHAGLAAGKSVSYGLNADDLPSLKMVAGLGYMPACREWTLEGMLGR